MLKWNRAGPTRAGLRLALVALAGTHSASAQTPVRWSRPESGSFLDPANWDGQVPVGSGFAAVVDAFNGNPYSVQVGSSIQTAKLTVGAAFAGVFVSAATLTADVVDLRAGSLGFAGGSGLVAQSVDVGPEALLRFESDSDITLSAGVLRGAATFRAPVRVGRDLALGTAALTVERDGLTFLDGHGLAGSGTVRFADDAGDAYLRAQAGRTFSLGQNIVVSAGRRGPDPTKASARLEGVVNFGTVRVDAADSWVAVRGENQGLLQLDKGHGVLSFEGVNASGGRIVAEGGFIGTPPELVLSNVDNRGTITGRGVRVSLSGTLTGLGAFRLEQSSVTATGTWPTASLRRIERVGTGLQVAGTLDNRGDTLDLDAFGEVNLPSGSRLLGGTVTGSATAGANLRFPGAGGTTLEGVTLDVPFTASAAAGGPMVVRGGLTVNKPLTIDAGNLSPRFVETQSLAGPGPVTLTGDLAPFPSRTGLAVSANAALTIAAETTVRTGKGGGYVGTLNAGEPDDFVSLVNRGTLVASAAADSWLTIGGRNWRNEGVIRVEPRAVLNLGGTFRFADVGTVDRGAGSVVNFASVRDLAGQTLDLNASAAGPLDLGSSLLTGGGRLVAPGRTVAVRKTDYVRDGLVVDGTTLALDLDVIGLADVAAAGGNLTLDAATVRLQGGNSQLVVTGSADPSLTGTGEVVFDASKVAAFGPRLAAGRIGPGITVRTGASGGSLVRPTTDDRVRNEGRIVSDLPGRAITTVYRVENAGTIDATAGGGVAIDGLLTNAGTVRATDGGTVRLPSSFVNTGSITADDATLILRGLPPNVGPTFRVRRGALAIDFWGATAPFRALDVAGSTIRIERFGNLLNAGVTLPVRDGTNTWRLTGGQITGGRVVGAGPVAGPADTLFVEGDSNAINGARVDVPLDVAPAGALVLTGTARFAGGTITLRSAELTLTDSVTLDPGTRIVFDGPLEIGALRPAGTALRVPAGAEVVTGTAGGTIGSLTSLVTNVGLVSSRTGGRAITFEGSVVNAGTIEGTAGDFVARIAAAGPAGAGPAGIAAEAVPPPPAKAFRNDGLLRLDAAADVAVTGPFVQTAAGTTRLAVGGPGDEEFAQVHVADGSAYLGGTLAVTLADGYEPLEGDAFRVLTLATGSTLAGVYDRLLMPTWAGGALTFLVGYDPEGVTLTAVPVPEPAAAAFLLAGAGLLVRRRRRRREG